MSQRLAPRLSELHPAKVFTWIALSTGLVLVAVTPPFQVPDEPHHFYRAYQVSEGHFVPLRTSDSVGGHVPRSLPSLAETIMGDVPFNTHVKQDRNAWARSFDILLLPADRIELAFPNTALAGPTAYLPQSVGIIAGSKLGMSALAVFYLGRIVSLLSCVAVTAFAIRLLPFRRWAGVLLAVLPMTLFVRSSLSSDGPTLALTMLALALCLRVAHTGNTSYWHTLAVLLVTAALLALGKPPYAAVVFLALAASPERVGGVKRYIAMLTALAVVFAVTQGAWALALRGKTALWAPGANPDGQITFLQEHPIQGAVLLASDVVRSAPALAHQGVGVLGWLDAPIPAAIAMLLALLVLLVALGEPAPPPAMVAYRWLGLAIVTVGTLALYLMNYVWWTPPGATHVDGIQGRHLLPLLPFLLVSFNVPHPLEQRLARLRPTLVIGFLVTSVLVTVMTVVNRYYVNP